MKVLWSPLSRTLLVVALSTPLLGIGGFQALFAPKKDPWPLWEAHDPASRVIVDHGTWDRLLQRYASQDLRRPGSADPDGWRQEDPTPRMRLGPRGGALTPAAIPVTLKILTIISRNNLWQKFKSHHITASAIED